MCIRMLALLFLLALPLPALSLERVCGGPACPHPPGPEDAPLLAKVEAWLNTLTTAKGRMILCVNNGPQERGDIYISRPGRMRIDFDDAKDFLVADGIFVYWYDPSLDEQWNTLIRNTEWDFVLRRKVSLDGRLMGEPFGVRSVARRDGLAHITLSRPTWPEGGQITLSFAEEPWRFLGWRSVDEEGRAEQIDITDLKLGVPLDPKLFRYVDPTPGSSPHDE